MFLLGIVASIVYVMGMTAFLSGGDDDVPTMIQREADYVVWLVNKQKKHIKKLKKALSKQNNYIKKVRDVILPSEHLPKPVAASRCETRLTSGGDTPVAI